MAHKNTLLLQLLFFGLLCFFVSGFAQALSDQEKQHLIERIEPVGKVYNQQDLEGLPSPGQTAAPAKPAGPRTGKQVYEAACFACHAAGVLQAPKLHNATDWKPRMQQGFDTMLSHALNGFNSMPARGTCGDCSDKEIADAIRYMIEGL